MEEKEMIEEVKFLLKQKQSRAEITTNFQQKGYKLEYINAIIKKAKRPKKLLINFSMLFLLLISLSLFASSIYLFKQKANLENPLTNFLNKDSSENNLTNLSEINLDEITLTPDFLNYLLNEIHAWELRKNPLNLENPMINFEISEQNFTSTITRKIETKEGTNPDADIKFVFEKKHIVEAIMTDNTTDYVKEKFRTGEAKIETLTDEKELFAKGYLSLYNRLSE
jgi:hypothetical protein